MINISRGQAYFDIRYDVRYVIIGPTHKARGKASMFVLASFAYTRHNVNAVVLDIHVQRQR